MNIMDVSTNVLQVNRWLLQPHIMDNIIHNTFIADGPIRLNRLSAEDYLAIPIFRQVEFLCTIVKNEGTVKLTATGNLPLRVVTEMYELGVPFYYYEKYPTRLRKETDSWTVHFARLVAEMGGLVKKRGNSLTITKKGEKCLLDNHLLLQSILVTLGYKLSWGYLDGYEDKRIGQYGFGFSLMLFALFGEEKRCGKFYSKIYFDEFRHLCYSERDYTCYAFRTFERFMENLGLIKIEGDRFCFMKDGYVVNKSALFDKMISLDANFGKITYDSQSGTPLYKFRINIIGSVPKIWREFIVPSDISLEQFHIVIQTIMGWTNSHLHDFIKGDKRYSKKYPDFMEYDDLGNIDYEGIKLCDLVNDDSRYIEYLYDYGDSWRHKLELIEVINSTNCSEEFLTGNDEFLTCTAGERRCPPEDCGGIRGYAEILEILKDPDHEEYEEYRTWLGENFDPEHFDLPNDTLPQFLASCCCSDTY